MTALFHLGSDQHVAYLADLIRAYAQWAGPLAFLVAFGESIAGIGMLFPATTTLVALGGSIEAGLVGPWPVFLGATLGAILGDTASYWLGRRCGSSAVARWLFARNPRLLARGHTFFSRYGAASVGLGRFFGAVRAFVPLVAGMMLMPHRRFQMANIISAPAWAAGLIGSGAVAGRFLPAIIESKSHVISLCAVTALVFLGLVFYACWRRSISKPPENAVCREPLFLTTQTDLEPSDGRGEM